MSAASILEDLVDSKFRQPENFDTIKRFGDWCLMAGANDWEAGYTAMAAQFTGRRIWVSIKHPSGADSDRSSADARKVAERGEAAVKAWESAAEAVFKRSSSKSWYEAFDRSLGLPEVKQYVASVGYDCQRWVRQESVEGDDSHDAETIVSGQPYGSIELDHLGDAEPSLLIDIAIFDGSALVADVYYADQGDRSYRNLYCQWRKDFAVDAVDIDAEALALVGRPLDDDVMKSLGFYMY